MLRPRDFYFVSTIPKPILTIPKPAPLTYRGRKYFYPKQRKRMRVAIVDDEWYGLDITYRLLTQIRKDLELVAFFQNPKEALVKIPLLEPNLIILDVEMPYLNGFEMYERLEGLHSKFWMVSAHGDAFFRNKSWNDDVGFLTKPFCKTDMAVLLNSMGWATAAEPG